MNILSYLNNDSGQELTVGEVVKKVSYRKYQVQIGNRNIVCRSSDEMSTGSRVVVAFTEKEHIILKQIGRRSRSVVEVIVDG